MKFPFKRFCALITLLTFAVSCFSQRASYAAVLPVSEESPAVGILKDAASVRVPAGMGKVQEFFQGNGKTVILIQDAHAIPDAQRNIKKLIDYFQKQYGVRLVATEGTASKGDAQIFKSFPDQELLAEVFEEYTKRGELSGANAAAIFSAEGGSASGGNETIFHGVEDWKLYEEGLGFYLAAMQKEPELLKDLEEHEKKLEEKKKVVYSKALLEIDRLLSNFRENRTDLIPVIKGLAKIQSSAKKRGQARIAVPVPFSFGLILKETERHNTDQSGIEMEVRKIAKQVAASLRGALERRRSNLNLPSPEIVLTAAKPCNDIAEFNQKFQEFQTSQITPQAFALYLQELIEKNCHPELPVILSGRAQGNLREGSQPEDSSACGLRMTTQLSRLVGDQKKMKDIEGTQFFRDFETYANAVKEKLFRNPEEQKLDRESHELELMTKLAKLELSREEWEEMKGASSLRTPAGVKQSQGAEIASSQKTLLAMTKDMNAHLAFYENAEKRDAAFLKNLLRLMSSQNQTARATRHASRVTSPAILIAGGFHSRGLAERLRAKGISYVLVRPKINSIPEATHYRDQMRGDVSWKNYFEVERGRISLYKAFVRAARDKLLGISLESSVVSREEKQSAQGLSPLRSGTVPEDHDQRSTNHDPRLLKTWRDQIIRDLANRGEIEKAGDYTVFMDEIVKKETNAKLQQGMERVEAFLAGLRNLESKHQLTEQNILSLLKPATMGAASIYGAGTPGAFLDAGWSNGFVMPAAFPAAKSEMRINQESQVVVQERKFQAKDYLHMRTAIPLMTFFHEHPGLDLAMAKKDAPVLQFKSEVASALKFIFLVVVPFDEVTFSVTGPSALVDQFWSDFEKFSSDNKLFQPLPALQELPESAAKKETPGTEAPTSDSFIDALKKAIGQSFSHPGAVFLVFQLPSRFNPDDFAFGVLPLAQERVREQEAQTRLINRPLLATETPDKRYTPHNEITFSPSTALKMIGSLNREGSWRGDMIGEWDQPGSIVFQAPGNREIYMSQKKKNPDDYALYAQTKTEELLAILSYFVRYGIHPEKRVGLPDQERTRLEEKLREMLHKEHQDQRISDQEFERRNGLHLLPKFTLAQFASLAGLPAGSVDNENLGRQTKEGTLPPELRRKLLRLAHADEKAFQPLAMWRKTMHEVELLLNARQRMIVDMVPKGHQRFSIVLPAWDLISQDPEVRAVVERYLTVLIHNSLFEWGSYLLSTDAPLELVRAIQKNLKNAPYVKGMDYLQNLYGHNVEIKFEEQIGQATEIILRTLPLDPYRGRHLGVDISAEIIKIAVVENGQKIEEKNYPWEPSRYTSPQEFLDKFFGILQEAGQKWLDGKGDSQDVSGAGINGIGISWPSAVIDNRILDKPIWLNGLSEKVFREDLSLLGRKVAKHFQVSVAVLNDGGAGALRAAIVSPVQLQEGNTYTYVGSIRTGLASGLVDPQGRMAPPIVEMGRVIVDMNPSAAQHIPRETPGAAQQLLPVRAFLRILRENEAWRKALGIQMNGLRLDSIPEDWNQILKEVEAKLQEKTGGIPQLVAEKIFQEIGRNWGHTIAEWYYSLHVRSVILTGPLTAGPGGKYILGTAQSVLKNEYGLSIPMELTKNGDDARMMGAAYAASQQLDETRQIYEKLAVRLAGGDVDLAVNELEHLAGRADITSYEFVMKNLLKASAAQGRSQKDWQVPLLRALLRLLRKPPTVEFLDVTDQFLADAMQSGLLGVERATRDPAYAAALTDLRNLLLESGQKKFSGLLAEKLMVFLQSDTAKFRELLPARAAFQAAQPSREFRRRIVTLSGGTAAGALHVPALQAAGLLETSEVNSAVSHLGRFGSSRDIVEFKNKAGYGVFNPVGDLLGTMSGFMTPDKRAYLMGDAGRIPQGTQAETVAGDALPFVEKTIHDPKVTLENDFFFFARVLFSSLRSVDRITREMRESAPLEGRDESKASQFRIPGVSFRNLYGEGIIAEYGFLKEPSPQKKDKPAIATPEDQKKFAEAIADAAKAAGLNGLRFTYSSFDPKTLYTVYSGTTLLLERNGEIRAVTLEPDGKGNFKVAEPLPSAEQPARILADGEAMTLHAIGIANRGGEIRLTLGEKVWELHDEDLNAIKLVNADDTSDQIFLAADGTGRPQSVEGQKEENPTPVANFQVDGQSLRVFVRGRVIISQTYIGQTVNYLEIKAGGVLDPQGKIPPPNSQIRLEPNLGLIQDLDQLKEGDLVLIAPGSLWTSILSHFLIKGIPEALARAKKRGVRLVFILNAAYDNESIGSTPLRQLETLQKMAALPLDAMFSHILGASDVRPLHALIRRASSPNEFEKLTQSYVPPQIRKDPNAALAKMSRGLMLVPAEDARKIGEKWPGLEFIPIVDGLDAVQVPKHGPGHDYRIIFEPGKIAELLIKDILPAASSRSEVRTPADAENFGRPDENMNMANQPADLVLELREGYRVNHNLDVGYQNTVLKSKEVYPTREEALAAASRLLNLEIFKKDIDGKKPAAIPFRMELAKQSIFVDVIPFDRNSVWINLVEGEKATKRLRLFRGESLLMGQGVSDNVMNFVISNSAVSATHLKIEFLKNGIYVQDTGSRGGTKFVEFPAAALASEVQKIKESGGWSYVVGILENIFRHLSKIPIKSLIWSSMAAVLLLGVAGISVILIFGNREAAKEAAREAARELVRKKAAREAVLKPLYEEEDRNLKRELEQKAKVDDLQDFKIFLGIFRKNKNTSDRLSKIKSRVNPASAILLNEIAVLEKKLGASYVNLERAENALSNIKRKGEEIRKRIIAAERESYQQQIFSDADRRGSEDDLHRLKEHRDALLETIKSDLRQIEAIRAQSRVLTVSNHETRETQYYNQQHRLKIYIKSLEPQIVQVEIEIRRLREAIEAAENFVFNQRLLFADAERRIRKLSLELAVPAAKSEMRSEGNAKTSADHLREIMTQIEAANLAHDEEKERMGLQQLAEAMREATPFFEEQAGVFKKDENQTKDSLELMRTLMAAIRISIELRSPYIQINNRVSLFPEAQGFFSRLPDFYKSAQGDDLHISLLVDMAAMANDLNELYKPMREALVQSRLFRETQNREGLPPESASARAQREWMLGLAAPYVEFSYHFLQAYMEILSSLSGNASKLFLQDGILYLADMALPAMNAADALRMIRDEPSAGVVVTSQSQIRMSALSSVLDDLDENPGIPFLKDFAGGKEDKEFMAQEILGAIQSIRETIFSALQRSEMRATARSAAPGAKSEMRTDRKKNLQELVRYQLELTKMLSQVAEIIETMSAPQTTLGIPAASLERVERLIAEFMALVREADRMQREAAQITDRHLDLTDSLEQKIFDRQITIEAMWMKIHEHQNLVLGKGETLRGEIFKRLSQVRAQAASLLSDLRQKLKQIRLYKKAWEDASTASFYIDYGIFLQKKAKTEKPQAGKGESLDKLAEALQDILKKMSDMETLKIYLPSEEERRGADQLLLEFHQSLEGMRKSALILKPQIWPLLYFKVNPQLNLEELFKTMQESKPWQGNKELGVFKTSKFRAFQNLSEDINLLSKEKIRAQELNSLEELKEDAFEKSRSISAEFGVRVSWDAAEETVTLVALEDEYPQALSRAYAEFREESQKEFTLQDFFEKIWVRELFKDVNEYIEILYNLKFSEIQNLEHKNQALLLAIRQSEGVSYEYQDGRMVASIDGKAVGAGAHFIRVLGRKADGKILLKRAIQEYNWLSMILLEKEKNAPFFYAESRLVLNRLHQQMDSSLDPQNIFSVTAAVSHDKKPDGKIKIYFERVSVFNTLEVGNAPDLVKGLNRLFYNSHGILAYQAEGTGPVLIRYADLGERSQTAVIDFDPAMRGEKLQEMEDKIQAVLDQARPEKPRAVKSEMRVQNFSKIRRSPAAQSEVRETAGRVVGQILGEKLLFAQDLINLAGDVQKNVINLGTAEFAERVRSEMRRQVEALARDESEKRGVNPALFAQQKARALRTIAWLMETLQTLDGTVAVAFDAPGHEKFLEEALRKVTHRDRVFGLLSGGTRLKVEGVSKVSVGALAELHASVSWGQGRVVENTKFIPAIRLGLLPPDLRGNKDILLVQSSYPADKDFGEFASDVSATASLVVAVWAGHLVPNIRDLSRSEVRKKITAALLKGHPELLKAMPDLLDSLLQFDGHSALSINQTVIAIMEQNLARAEIRKAA